MTREEYDRWRSAAYWPTVFHEPRTLLKIQAAEKKMVEEVSSIVLPHLLKDSVIIVNPERYQDGNLWISVTKDQATDLFTAKDPVLLAINRVADRQRTVLTKDHHKRVVPDDEIEYLCTGYIAFCHREPTLVGSMALLHSRIKIVVFMQEDPVRGALSSRLRLHGLPQLNHHFSVYQASLE
jgi:tRNA(Arg) A34 adenosine deaminase TadA